jgi:hypothetical protein
VVQVRIREQKVLRYPRACFVESGHGDGCRNLLKMLWDVELGAGENGLSMSSEAFTGGGRHLTVHKQCR